MTDILQPSGDANRSTNTAFDLATAGPRVDRAVAAIASEIHGLLTSLQAQQQNPSAADLGRLQYADALLTRIEQQARVYRQELSAREPLHLERAQVLLMSGSEIWAPPPQKPNLIDWAKPHFDDLLQGRAQTITMIPYALEWLPSWHDAIVEKVTAMGYRVKFIDEFASPLEGIQRSEAIYLEGGSTPMLLQKLYQHELISAIRERVREGMPYIGSSAGSNVAMQEISTTNDMPIVDMPTRRALNILPVALNPHFLDPVPALAHCGETRDMRIEEYHIENGTPVIGLREGSVLRVDCGRVHLRGQPGQTMRWFLPGNPPQEMAQGDLTELLLPLRQ